MTYIERDAFLAMWIVRAFCFVSVNDFDLLRDGYELCWKRRKASQEVAP
jgi:hypothetical protein